MNRLIPVEELLCSGGDARIMRDAQGANKYGCYPTPQPDILAYGSCTASTISTSGFAAAKAAYQRLGQLSVVAYARQMERLRREIAALAGLDGQARPDIIFGASGTDLHLFVAQLFAQAQSSLLIVMPEASEMGSGVPAALHGCHFSARAALGGVVTMGEAIGHEAIEVAEVGIRLENDDPRPVSHVDADVERLAAQAVNAGRHVLLTLTDISKTGLLAPSPACALGLKRRFPDKVDILVDACQFRLGNPTLQAYLAQDCLLAITGSKFVTGPAFSSALLMPQAVARRLRACALPPGLRLYSARADWPDGWAARRALSDTANYSLLLRWEAALAQWRAFHALPVRDIRHFLETFRDTVQERLTGDPAFEPLASMPLNRQPLAGDGSWDHIPTIFPFLMRHPASGTLLNRAQMMQLYERLRQERCQIGQPVACGMREGITVSALRLCADMRLTADALSPEGRGGGAVIADALRVLDKAALLVKP